MNKNKIKRYKYKKDDKTITFFAEFMKSNREKVYKAAAANTTKDENNITVITKDDSWRDEKNRMILEAMSINTGEEY
ncbi:hypothetical protein [Alkaliphilus sp. B6464]|uniref:hypothetical protein n=1 Tax=Alkaliphilus sp. B6464 TaxID=2731219 RepID=UPI001BADBF4D|nr:hypothetical protein [Alkaliphilus sp. B6464]QUH19788.1 hypothetical protein HYG84_07645 [Alkaliphilus sp. B6464]